MDKTNKFYKALISHFSRTANLDSCSSVLAWDRETYMPKKGIQHRAEQLALLSGIAHDWDTNPKIEEWLSECEISDLVDDPLSIEAVNIRELRRIYDKKIKLPKRLVEETSRATSLGHQAWIEARSKADFKIFEPWLSKIVNLRREYAYTIGYKEVVYDALLDDYEPGTTADSISEVFQKLSQQLVPLIDKIMNACPKNKSAILNRKFPTRKQVEFCKNVMSEIGFDFKSGRIDTVVHSFCTGLGPRDTRITTRWDERNFSTGFFGILHEMGHGLYNQGLPKNLWGTPMGNAISLGIHESQSRLWENIIGRNRHFWNYFFPKILSFFPTQFQDVSLDQFLACINQVCPSFIRVEADEVTYNLHVVLRFEIEQAMISGRLKSADVPTVWNENFKELFGLEVPDDSQGCLQDVHWSYGNFGYFPTYTLGNLYAAQFYEQAIKDINGLENEIRAGNFSPLLQWLTKNIYSQGMRYYAHDLINKITGEPLNSQYLLSQLNKKYSRLYNF